MNKGILVTCLSFHLIGCETEQVKSDWYCHNADNSKIESGGTGFRQVEKLDQGNTTLLGYWNNNEFVLHSECSPAKSEFRGHETFYSWYVYGNVTELEGISSINDSTTDTGLTKIIATRSFKAGQWQTEFTESGKVTKQIWLSQPDIDLIIARDDFEGDGIHEVVVTIGPIAKRKRWNSNSQQFDCRWVSDGFITQDLGCTSERDNDAQIIGVEVNSDDYLNAIKAATPNYELDVDVYYKDVLRYWPLSRT